MDGFPVQSAVNSPLCTISIRQEGGSVEKQERGGWNSLGKAVLNKLLRMCPEKAPLGSFLGRLISLSHLLLFPYLHTDQQTEANCPLQHMLGCAKKIRITMKRRD